MFSDFKAILPAQNIFFPHAIILVDSLSKETKGTCFVLALRSRMPKLPGSPEKGVWSAMMGNLERAIVSDH